MDEDNFNPDIICELLAQPDCWPFLTWPSHSVQGNKPFISLPKGKGIKLSIAEERDKRLGVKA